MIKHYFKIAFRNLAKQKVLAFINISGLSIGLACFILFLLYSVNEFSFDRFHKNSANIHRVYIWYDAINGNEPGGGTYLPMPLGPAMKQDLPGIENYIRLRDSWSESFVRVNNKVMRSEFSFADPEFFSVFSFKLKSGNIKTALKDLHSVVLTEETSKNLFGRQNPVGKIIEIKVEDKFQPFTVTAVAEDIPSNSSIHFKILGNFNFLATTSSGARSVDNWRLSAYQTFVKLKPGSNLPYNRNLLLAFRKKYNAEEEAEIRKNGWKGKELPIWYGFQPLRSMHTDIRFGGAKIPSIAPKTIWILLSIATGVLLIACINFTTLAIGRSAGRSKEIGVRKVIGGTKASLVFQFLAEALLLTVISALTGFLLAKILLPFFNQLSDRQLRFSFTQFPELLWMITALILVVGLLAGSYPALVLSTFKPVEVLKTKIKLAGSNVFTKSLVTVQFILSAGLIICTIIIIQQLRFMRSKNPGFNKENVIMVDANEMDTKKIYPLFKQELANHPEIIGVASSELGLGEGTGWSMSGFEYNGKHRQVYEYFIDHDYLNVMGMKLLAGRNFDPNIAADTVRSIIVNEAMARDFGWTVENAVGQQIKGYREDMTPVVIGVVKDFNFSSFSRKIEPQLFHQYASYLPYKFFVRIKPGDPSNALAAVQSAWKMIVPEYPVKYSFLDEDLDRFYKAEARWSNIVGWAGGISIFLACLGLLGLTMLSAVNRIKEIGIRKVLGATITNITALLSKDFLKLVLISLVVASPLAWYFMNKWLEGFAYRINISWWIFLLVGVLSILIALITISFQAIRAALTNPVKSLRTE
jgi:putative ABC transport system permease protein